MPAEHDPESSSLDELEPDDGCFVGPPMEELQAEFGEEVKQYRERRAQALAKPDASEDGHQR